MLSLPKHLVRIARVMSLTVRARCFDKLSITGALLPFLSFTPSPPHRSPGFSTT